MGSSSLAVASLTRRFRSSASRAAATSVRDAAGSGDSLNVALTMAARGCRTSRRAASTGRDPATFLHGAIGRPISPALHQCRWGLRDADAREESQRRAVAVAQGAAVVRRQRCRQSSASPANERIERQPLLVQLERDVHIAECSADLPMSGSPSGPSRVVRQHPDAARACESTPSIR